LKKRLAVYTRRKSDPAAAFYSRESNLITPFGREESNHSTVCTAGVKSMKLCRNLLAASCSRESNLSAALCSGESNLSMAFNSGE
jgi:hypothetical protein